MLNFVGLWYKLYIDSLAKRTKMAILKKTDLTLREPPGIQTQVEGSTTKV